MRMFDDEAVPTIPVAVTATHIEGHGPSHVQAEHARAVRRHLAPSDPDSVQRAGPSPITFADTGQPQQFPQHVQVDEIDLDEAVGQESGQRPGQSPFAGWDGELDSYAPDWTHPTTW